MRWSKNFARTAFYQSFMTVYSKAENCLSQQNFYLTRELKISSILIRNAFSKPTGSLSQLNWKTKYCKCFTVSIWAYKTKNLGRYYVWWPKIDEDIENLVKSCEPCQLNRNDPYKHSSHSWQYLAGPWQRIHIDYCGPFRGHMYLLRYIFPRSYASS